MRADEYPYSTQLQMVWPDQRIDSPPAIELPSDYRLRTFEWGDQTRWYELMALAGWTDWDGEKLQPWLERILPDGWFMLVHAAQDCIVASAMCLHHYTSLHPFGGELGWVAADPAHAGKGLGRAVCAAVTTRFLDAGYSDIHLYTEDYRYAALRTYLRLGYVPFLYLPDMADRWRAICAQVDWPFTPQEWPEPAA
jgi:mycothiol synthase